MRQNIIVFYRKKPLGPLIFLFILGFIILLQVLFAVESEKERIKIGLVVPISGPPSYRGVEMKQAAIDAVALLNAHGGLLDQEIELVIRDDGCNLYQAREIAEELAADSKVCAVIGHCPSVARDVAEVYDSNKKIFISILTPNRDFSKSFQSVFRIGINEERLGKVAAKAIATDFWSARVVQEEDIGIVIDDSQFGSNLADVLEEELKAKNINVEFKQTVRNSTDFKLLWEETQPEILFFSVSEPTFISNMLGNNPPPVTIVTVGMPFTSDNVWDNFWRWRDEAIGHRGVFVIAPAVSPGEQVYSGGPELSLRFDFELFDIDFSIPQVYIVTALDILAQVISQSQSTDTDLLNLALRSTLLETFLGGIRSNETGEIGPIPYKLYSGPYFSPTEHYFWTPSNAIIIEYYTGAGPPAGPPEYNIEVNPKESSEPLVLIPDQETKVKFFIGPRSDESLTPGMKPSDILDALADGRDLDLTVALFCDLAEKNTYHQQKICYSPSQGQSNSATFVIRPSLAAVQNNHGLGKLIFVVDANGMEIDVIRLDAIVGEPSQEALNNYSPPTKLFLDRMLPEEISIPDAIIAFAPAQEKNAVPVVIRLIHNKLLANVQKELGDTNEFWIFDSGVTLEDLRGLVRDNYFSLLTLVKQKNKDLQDIYERIGTDSELGQVLISRFKKDQTEKILKEIGDKGSDLYWRIFKRGDKGLLRAMRAINSFELDRPLRIRILAEKIYGPWQILYPDPETDSINPKLFWGFRYELGTLQLVDKAQGRMLTVVSEPRPDEVIFGAWRGLSNKNEKDWVRQHADEINELLEKNVGGKIKYCHSKKTFISEIQSRSSSVKLILAYGHGSCGTEIIGHTSDSDEQILIPVPNVIGPYFIFDKGPNETLIPRDFDRLARREPNFLKSQPIVIMNACETGTSGIRTADNNGFVGALTRMGARAAIVTEAPVWDSFAYQFGTDLIELLLDGKEARTAMLEARLKHLDKAGNPFGLLYSLYGNPASRISKE